MVGLGAGSLFYRDSIKRRWFRIRASGVFNRWLLRGFGVRIRWKGLEKRPPLDTPALYVGNHVSDLDALLINSSIPAIFVTSVEIAQTPVLGMLARLGGGMYVERRQRFTLLRELNEMVDFYHQGFSIALFPEGTSTDGSQLYPFKNALFRAAIAAEVPVVPLCLQYMAVDGQPLSPSNRDSIFYYGKMTFWSHLVRLCRVRTIDVEVSVLDPIPLRDTDSRKSVCHQAREAIARAYRPVM